jgi:serine/threonine protein kinase
MAIHELKHPNIVEYHALYIDMRKKLCSIVMEYVKFPSLDKLKIHAEEELKEIIYQVLDSVKYLHEKNISHRDIKP